MTAPRLVWIGGLVVLVLLAAWKLTPWLTADRAVITSSPSLGGLISATYPTVRPGQRACVAPVPLPAESRALQVLAGRGAGSEPPPLRFTVTAPGYRTSVTTSQPWPAGGSSPVVADLPSPPPADVVARVCVRNLGEDPITLAGTDEPRSQVVAESTVAGRRVDDVSLTVYGQPTSFLSELPQLVDRAAAMASLPPAAVAWLVAILLIATPIFALAALAIAFRAQEPDDEPARS